LDIHTPRDSVGIMLPAFFRLLPLLGALVCTCFAADPTLRPDGQVSSRSFVDQAQIISNYQTELYAHQSGLRIVQGIGYAVYQCNESNPEENKAGQVARMAVFNILNPTATAKWVDIAKACDSSGGVTLGDTFVSAPMIHALGEETLRIFFTGRQEGDPVSAYRAFSRDYRIATATLSELHPLRCTIAKEPDKVLDLTQAALQSHLDFLFGAGTGASFSKGISTACDFVEFNGQLYSTIQIKNSQDGQTRLLTNILMRSADHGSTWELLGAPDPRQLTNEVKILAEPVITQDKTHVYLHLRSNVIETGYMLSKAAKTDLYHFDAPVTKWTYGIGRPTLCDFGKPIGLVALFTAPSIQMGGNTVTRNKCDVVQIDNHYQTYTKAFSIVDFNAVNTPFMHLYRDEVYVTYTTGRRRLLPKFGTSEVVFSKLRREFFIPAE
jgi:hypothetical protein